MKKYNKRFLALLTLLMMLFSSVNITASAAEVPERTVKKTEYISLYQNGDLGEAYTLSDSTKNASSYKEGSAEYILYQGFKDMKSSIDLSALEIKEADGIELYRQVINSNPDLFYVTNSITVWTFTDGTVSHFEPDYIGTKTQVEGMVTEFEQAVNKALAGIKEEMTDLDKALYLHDYIIKRNAYDFANFNANTVPSTGHSAYGCLVLNTSVCDGYSLAYSYLLQKAGIESRLITGPGHAWNAIKLNGNYYHVDLTFNDPDINGWGDRYDYVGHSYFLLTDDELKSDGNISHSKWEQSISATDTTYTNAAFKNVKVQYGYYDDNWYYLDKTENVIRQTKNPAEIGNKFYNLSDLSWPEFGVANGGYWPGYWGSVDVSENNGKVYFNTKDTIKSIDLTKENATPETVCTVDVTTGYIYGFNIIEDTLTYGLAPSPNHKEVTYSISIEEAKDVEMIDFAFDKAEVTLGIGGTYTPKIIYTPEKTNPIPEATWKSLDETVATVDSEGKITAVAAGEVSISCTISGIEHLLTVNVTDVIPGDANNDGLVDANDALAILKSVAHMEISAFNEAAADCNGIAGIDANDALWVLKKVAHMI